MALDPTTGNPQDGERVAHAPAAWDRMVRSLARDLPRELTRTRELRRKIRRLR